MDYCVLQTLSHGTFTGNTWQLLGVDRYVFVLNMIGLHAGLLVVMGRVTNKLYRSYSIFHVVGATLAMQIPVVVVRVLLWWHMPLRRTFSVMKWFDLQYFTHGTCG